MTTISLSSPFSLVIVTTITIIDNLLHVIFEINFSLRSNKQAGPWTGFEGGLISLNFPLSPQRNGLSKLMEYAVEDQMQMVYGCLRMKNQCKLIFGAPLQL